MVGVALRAERAPDLARRGRLEATLRVTTLAGVVVAAVTATLHEFLPHSPRLVTVATTVASVVIGLIAGLLEFVVEGRHARRPSPDTTPSATTSQDPKDQPAVGRSRFNRFWMGVALVLALFTLASPWVAPLALLAGLLAFRQRLLAAGVGVVLGGLVALLVLAAFAYHDDSRRFVRDASDTAALNMYFSSLQQRCYQGGPVADANACGYAYDGLAQQQLLLMYQYDACRQDGNTATQCSSRLP